MSAEREVGLFEAKTHLSELVSEVEGGATLTITRRGVPVARLVPIQDDVHAQRVQALSRMAALRTELETTGARFTVDEILAARDEGRR